MSGPDRVWAFDYDLQDNDGTWRNWQCWSEAHPKPLKATEYVRRDPAVIAALPEVQALIAGVLGQAASMMEDNVRHAAELGREIWPIPDLRTLTPADAIAARDAMIAEAVAKEREACAELAASSTVPSQTAMRLSAAIRKRGNV